MINLIVNWYCSPNAARQSELEYCILNNYLNPLIGRLILISKAEDLYRLPEELMEDNRSKVSFVIQETRPTYNHFFGVTHLYQNDINIISNSDIVFSGSLKHLTEVQAWIKKSWFMFALNRWELLQDGTAILKNQPDSQDVWIFFGMAPVLADATFTMGMAGCDNKIAYLIAANGQKVFNPSKTIECIHVHKSQVRTYDVAADHKIIKPPFKTIWPHELKDCTI